MSATMTATKPDPLHSSSDAISDNDRLRVPARILYQMDTHIKQVEQSIAKKQQQLAELKAARARMVRDRDE